MFCDTSTLAKYYVQEKESAAVRTALHAASQVVLSELAKAELMAVFHRRLREGRWSQLDFVAHCRQFARDDAVGQWSWLPLDGVIVEQAVKTYTLLPANIFLRTSDCLHLMTALHHGFAEIHTHDSHQFAAAIALGLKAVAIKP
ncbi:MAG: type II toxin-antitoxin system VapC family toxin [Opitutaceae bacterium]